MDNYFIFDIETDSLNASKIHCISVIYKAEDTFNIKSTSDYDEMIKFFTTENRILIGHNIRQFDIPTVERILNIKIPKSVTIIDTLPISWYLYEEREEHGLESWGETFGIQKPPIDDWENLSIEEYIHRCTEDTKINHKLWINQYNFLMDLYENNEDEVLRLCKFVSNKMYCAHLASKSKWKLDIELCKKNLNELQEEKLQKTNELEELMPKTPVKGKIKKPAETHKKDGSLSLKGYEWFDLLKSLNLPEDHTEDIEVIKKYQKPNAGSSVQVKEWLFSLGWKPKSFDERIGKDGVKKQVPKISNSNKKLCVSVIDLAEKEPGILVLEGINVLTSRIGILKGFLNAADEDGYIYQKIVGFANTLRMRHGTIVNIPKMSMEYGKYIRPCLTSPDGYELCDSDLSSLENMTRNNFIYNLDKEYVETMLDKGFDSHLDLAVSANMITNDEQEFYKWYKKQK